MVNLYYKYRTGVGPEAGTVTNVADGAVTGALAGVGHASLWRASSA